jgi:hypothetical protein
MPTAADLSTDAVTDYRQNPAHPVVCTETCDQVLWFLKI